MDREQLTESAAKAMFEALPPNNPHGPSSDLAFDEPYTREYSAKLRVLAEAAFAVFEGAYTTTDDFPHGHPEIDPTDDEHAEWASEVWQSIADAIGNVGYDLNSEEETQAWVERYLLQRTVQGEPTPDGWFAFGSHAPYPWVGHLEFSDEKDESGMPLWERPVQGEPDLMDRLKASLQPAPKPQGESSDAQILRDEIAYRIRTAVTYGMGSRKAGRTPEQRADWIDCEVAYALGAIGAKRAALRAAAETGGER